MITNPGSTKVLLGFCSVNHILSLLVYHPLNNHVILCAKLERCKQACGKGVGR